MDNSEMMAQMTQMAMVQSLGTMTSNMKEEMALTKTTYLAGLIGKEVTVKLPNAENSLIEGSPKEKTGVIESVNLSGKEATFRMAGDSTDYSLESLLQIRQAGTGSGATTNASAAGPETSMGSAERTNPGGTVNRENRTP